MSVNTAHASNGVLIHSGEYILLHSDNVAMEFSGQSDDIFNGTKVGRIYLTSHRLIFNNRKSDNPMQSFSAPFIAMSDVELEQPVFGANYIKGKVRAQPNGNFVGEVKFKLYFKSGGAIEYGMALLRAAKTAQSNYHRNINDDPPPYTPSGNWYEAPPPAYQPPPGYFGWLPQHEAFSGPAPNTVFISDNPPPYPGIGGPPPAYNPYQPPAYNQPPPTHPYNPTQPLAYNPTLTSQDPNTMPPWNSGNNVPPSVAQTQQQHTQSHESKGVQEEMPSWNGFSLPPAEEEERQQRQRQQQQHSAAPNQSWGGGYNMPSAVPPYPPYQAQSAPPPYAQYPPYPQPGMAPHPPPYPPYPPQQSNCPPAGAMGFHPPPTKSNRGNINQNWSTPSSSRDIPPPAYEDLSFINKDAISNNNNNSRTGI